MKKDQMNKPAVVTKKNLVPGSKIPIKYLFDYIKNGYTISDFLSSYPWLKRESVEKALDEIKRREFSQNVL